MRGAALIAAAFFATAPTHAQGLTGYAQGQYQTFEQSSPNPDGSIRKQRLERWVQTLELQHMATPRADLHVLSSFRLTDLAYRGLPDASRSPQGSIQVSHPWANLYAAYRPSAITTGFGATGSAPAGDTARAFTLTARTQETVFTGQIAPPAWPRLDLAWTRRHRDRDALSPEEAGVNRLARMSWSNERLNLYGSLADQKGERSGVASAISQRTGAAGAALHLAPLAGSNVDLSYDLSDARVGDPRRTSGSSRAHSASLNAGWRPGGIGAWSGSWLWRRTEFRGPRPTASDDHDGSLQYALDPPGPARLLGALAARTVNTLGHRALARSASAVASLDGHVRSGCTGVATLTHVTNWEPGRGNWSVEAIRAATQMRLARGFDGSLDAQVSTSDDTTLRDVRANTEANARARFTPWPAFTAGWNSRVSRNGSGVIDAPRTVARASGWDVRWRPLRAIELTGTTATTRVAGGARSWTRTAGMRWAARANVQITGDWSRSTDQRYTTGIQPVSGREIASAHALLLLTRKLQLDAAAGVADRGGPRENRQASMTLTWAFGR